MSHPRTNPKSAFPNNAMRILLFILEQADLHKPVHMGIIAKHFGWSTRSYAHQMLEILRFAGLITYDGNNQGTIRPTCRFTLHHRAAKNLKVDHV